MRPSIVLIPVLVSVAFACADDGGSAADTAGATDTTASTDAADAATDADPEVDVPPAPPALAVTIDDACRGGAEERWQCGRAEAPLDWDDPSGPTITLSFLRRLATPPARGQLWVLPGGPGGTAFGSKDAGDFFAGEVTDLDVYLVDHRGVGDATRLSCPPWLNRPGSLDAALACAAALRQDWTDDALARFSSDAAGRDVSALIAAMRSPGAEVYLLGTSYGARWALRALDHMREPPTGVLLDSVLPDDASFPDLVKSLDDTARALFDKCGADATCGGKLGADPWQALTDALAAVDAGACPTERGLERTDYVEALAAIVSSPALALAPAFVHRLARCGPADEAVIMHVMDLLAAPPLPEEEYGQGLGVHVLASELWPATLPTAGDVAAAEADLALSWGQASLMRDTAAGWPRYVRAPPPPPRTDVPILALNRTHDPATGVAGARRLDALLTGDFQTLVEVAGFGHSMGGSACGVDLMLAFLENPYAPPAAGCAPLADTLRFAGTVFEAQAAGIFDASPWGDEPE